ncbi:MAG: tetratricopeptide repeat protein [Pyrinomonadaceae bacterium]
MKKVKNNTYLSILGLLIFASSALTGCINKTAAAIEEDPVSVTSEADPRIRAALLLIEKMPVSAAGFNQLASLYMQKARTTGDFSLVSKAETATTRALDLSPADVPARKLRAAQHLSFHRFAEALQDAEKMKLEYPNDPFVYGLLSDANVELGNYDEAVKAVQKMIDLKPNSMSYSRASQVRALHGDSTGAIEMMTLAAKTTDPGNKEEQSWCLVQLGDQLWKIGDYPRAERIYDEALENTPDFYLALAGKGRIMASKSDLASAVTYLTRAQDKVPNLDVIILLGDIYTRLGETAAADRQYALAEIVEQKLGAGGDQRRLALLWADRDMNLVEALTIAQRRHETSKDTMTADTYAWCLYKNARYDEARFAINEAMRLGTKDARMIYHAGMIERSLGNKKEARKLLTAATKLNPSFDLIQSDVARKNLAELGQ